MDVLGPLGCVTMIGLCIMHQLSRELNLIYDVGKDYHWIGILTIENYEFARYEIMWVYYKNYMD